MACTDACFAGSVLPLTSRGGIWVAFLFLRLCMCMTDVGGGKLFGLNKRHGEWLVYQFEEQMSSPFVNSSHTA